MESMNLTEEERCMVLAHRRKIDDELKIKACKLLLLARDYLEWMVGNGAGSTYSTFCNDFGYGATEGESRNKTYEDVMFLINASKDAVYNSRQ